MIPRPIRFLAAGLLLLAGACGPGADTSPAHARNDEAEDEARIRVSFVAEPPAPAPLTPAEVALQKKLEDGAVADRPTHRVVFRTGRVAEGRLVTETESSIRLREGFGYSGFTITPYKRADIAGIEALPAADYTVTPSDVRLAAEFSQFHFVKAPPYSIVTDESFGDVQKILTHLTTLREQFEKTFATILSPRARPRDIQVIFFGREDGFRRYAQRTAPALAGSAGFYATRDNRLALLNQLGSSHFRSATDRLASRQREFSDAGDLDPHAVYEIKGRIVAARADITSEAKAMTERVIRHEGAHQLFYCFGVHSRFGLEPTWLVEGLAEYCEPAEIGRWHAALAQRVAKARDTKTLLPLEKLLNHQNAAGFFALGADQAEIAYAQSWSLVYFLMEDEHRPAFLDLIRTYRDGNPNHPVTDHAGLLCKTARTDLAALDADWRRFIARL